MANYDRLELEQLICKLLVDMNVIDEGNIPDRLKDRFPVLYGIEVEVEHIE